MGFLQQQWVARTACLVIGESMYRLLSFSPSDVKYLTDCGWRDAAAVVDDER